MPVLISRVEFTDQERHNEPGASLCKVCMDGADVAGGRGNADVAC